MKLPFPNLPSHSHIKLNFPDGRSLSVTKREWIKFLSNLSVMITLKRELDNAKGDKNNMGRANKTLDKGSSGDYNKAVTREALPPSKASLPVSSAVSPIPQFYSPVRNNPYKVTAEVIARIVKLRDEHGLTFLMISKRFSLHELTVSKAYKEAKRAAKVVAEQDYSGCNDYTS